MAGDLTHPDSGPDPAATLLRRGLLSLAVLGTAGTGLELLLLRHWDNGLELIPFVALGTLAVAIGFLVRRPNLRVVRIARAIAGTVLVTSAIGVFIHIRANYEAAPLDYRFTDSWPSTPELIRWLLAATDTVGPSPTLAPAAIGFAALAVLLATMRHPAIVAVDQSTLDTVR